ncbi:MAG TPA: methyltransferase domain-containing protein [Thermoanaerobaculia bacterium]|nr:methyltransferase domain-containing protein [Thermoanaerobaculia bacterium]
MRRRHLEDLRPICLVCQTSLTLSAVLKEEQGHVIEGTLRCQSQTCQREYPILDGIPFLLANLRGYVAGAIDQIDAREDLDPATESLLGDCCGPGSAYDTTRQHLSTYAWDHYGDLDPEEAAGGDRPGSVLRVLERGLALAGEIPEGPILDLGCAVGRSSFALAGGGGRLVLGTDLSVPMLRLASRILHRDRVRYPRRRVGIVYDRRDFPVSFPNAERVDFWLADAAGLPFPAGTFAAVVGLNVLDCVASPHDLLAALPRLLAPGGKAILSTPYDWSPRATPVEAWIGGHSQRGEHQGASEPVLRALLTPGAHPASIEGLRIVAEEADIPWRVRMHERSSVEYRVDLVVVERG